MSIEEEIFKRTNFDFNKLIKYGFIKESENYKYSKMFLDNFRADIIVSKNGVLSGRIFDLVAESEYIAFRIETQTGQFVNKIREEYKKILIDICDNCVIKNYFIFNQSNRIADAIKKMYQDEPEFLWEKYPGYGVFRNSNNDKWYAVIINIDKSKIDEKETGEVEVINLKLTSTKISLLLTRKGFYPSYHMSKKNWITIILDDTISDNEILEYIKESHNSISSPSEWLVPANPKYYDIINCFNDTNNILWKQSSNVNVGDIVFIYVGNPYSAIMYKCEASEVNIPYDYQDEKLSMKYVMKLNLIRKYDSTLFPFTKLKEFGVNAIRGPRSIPEKLSKELNS